MPADASLKTRRLADYPFHLEYRTRWSDNDMYQHMNNAVYVSGPRTSRWISFENAIYDSVINTYLIEHCGLRPLTSPQYGMVVHSHNDYFSAIAFPAVAELGLRVNQLGRTSVTYEIALFQKGIDEVKAVGEFIQVFVDRSTGRPSAAGMNPTMRRGLERLMGAEARARL